MAIACNPQALSPDQWAAHQLNGQRLFRQALESVEELPAGFAFVFPIGELGALALFIDRERCCCPFLTFALDVLPAATTVTLRMTGTHTAKAILAQELLPPVA